MDKTERSWLDIIYNRGTATYRNGWLDFSRGEGGNNHIYCYNRYGSEIGYIWFDTHCSEYGFCGKSSPSCNGIFSRALRIIDPVEWMKTDVLFHFTERTFDRMMQYVISQIR